MKDVPKFEETKGWIQLVYIFHSNYTEPTVNYHGIAGLDWKHNTWFMKGHHSMKVYNIHVNFKFNQEVEEYGNFQIFVGQKAYSHFFPNKKCCEIKVDREKEIFTLAPLQSFLLRWEDRPESIEAKIRFNMLVELTRPIY